MKDPAVAAHLMASAYSRRACFPTSQDQVVAYNGYYAGYMMRFGDDENAAAVAELTPIERLQDLNRIDALMEEFEDGDLLA